MQCIPQLSYIMLMVTWCHSECCVASGLDFKPLVVPLYVTLCFKGIESL